MKASKDTSQVWAAGVESLPKVGARALQKRQEMEVKAVSKGPRGVGETCICCEHFEGLLMEINNKVRKVPQ